MVMFLILTKSSMNILEKERNEDWEDVKTKIEEIQVDNTNCPYSTIRI